VVVHAGQQERAIPLGDTETGLGADVFGIVLLAIGSSEAARLAGGILGVAFCAMTLTPGTRSFSSSLATGGTPACGFGTRQKRRQP
jgi:hypothetical protein